MNKQHQALTEKSLRTIVRTVMNEMTSDVSFQDWAQMTAKLTGKPLPRVMESKIAKAAFAKNVSPQAFVQKLNESPVKATACEACGKVHEGDECAVDEVGATRSRTRSTRSIDELGSTRSATQSTRALKEAENKLRLEIRNILRSV